MQIYKPSEFAKCIGVSIKTLQRWDDCGKFKANRTPTNRRYYTQDHYDEYMQSQNENPFEHNIKNELQNKSEKFAIIQMDINGFKTLNHIYGKETCDNILKTIENQLIAFTKNKNLVHRSNDVFTILYPFDSLENLTNSIKTLNTNITSRSNILYRIAWGVYIIECNNDEIWMMIDKAAIARQAVKNTATNNINIYTKVQQDNIDKTNIIENKMQTALENNEFKLYLQPKYDMVTNKIIGAEALIRWIQSDGSMVMPNDFIPIFEQNGFVVYTDHFIWEETCKTLHDWKQRSIPLVPISINASRRNLNDPNFIKSLMDFADTYDIDRTYLEIEITESANIDIDNQILINLRNSGFRLLMDDFGTKYSSLNTLCNADFDVIKLDKRIIDNIYKNNKGLLIAQKIIALLKDIDLGIIAEGVETKKQAAFLKNNGCIEAQGFLYAKPMPVNEFEKMLLSN